MNEDRLADLESRILYQEDHIQALNNAVFELQKQVERLQAEHEMAKTRLRELEQNQGLDLDPDETPPHY